MVFEFLKKLFGKKPEEKKEENPFEETAEEREIEEAITSTTPISSQAKPKRGKGGKFVKDKRYIIN